MVLIYIYIHNTYIDNHKSVQRGRGEVMHGYATSGYPSGMNGFVFAWEHSFFFRIWSVLCMEGILQQKVRISTKWMPKNWSSEQSLVIFFGRWKHPPIVDDLLLEDIIVSHWHVQVPEGRGFWTSVVKDSCPPTISIAKSLGFWWLPEEFLWRYLKSSKNLLLLCHSFVWWLFTNTSQKRASGWMICVEHEYELIWTNK